MGNAHHRQEGGGLGRRGAGRAGVLPLLLAVGAPLGDAAWGGTHGGRPATVARIGTWVLTALLAVGTLADLLLAPVTLALAVLCLLVARGASDATRVTSGRWPRSTARVAE